MTEHPRGLGPVRAEGGRFVVLEGGEASGKSTQAARLAERLDAVLTREPGGTAIGAGLRDLLLDARTTGLADRAEALLMAADRAQHVAEVIRPALAAGRHVVSDRYVGSTLAYQGFGRGLPVDELRRLSAWAAHGLEPDVIVLLDMPPALTADRVAGRSARPPRGGRRRLPRPGRRGLPPPGGRRPGPVGRHRRHGRDTRRRDGGLEGSREPLSRAGVPRASMRRAHARLDP
jgi:dTMP kinase